MINFPKHVLLIDDEPLQLETLERAFTNAGAVTVATASDGYEAKWLMTESRPPFDLIILDLCLPGFDGFEMLNYFNAQGVRYPVHPAVRHAPAYSGHG